MERRDELASDYLAKGVRWKHEEGTLGERGPHSS
jgi:hypothetical protein